MLLNNTGKFYPMFMVFFGCFTILYSVNLIKGAPLAKYFFLRNFTWLVVIVLFYLVSKRWKEVVNIFVFSTFTYIAMQNIFLSYSGWVEGEDIEV